MIFGFQHSYTRITQDLVLSVLLMLSGCGGQPVNQIPAAEPQIPAENARAKQRKENPPLVEPILVEEGFLKRINIIAYGEKFYALAQNEGAFEIKKFQDNAYHLAFVADSIEAVKRKAELGSQTGANAQQASGATLVERDYKREFNIIKYGDKYYALAKNEGRFDIQKIEKRQYKRYFAGNSVAEVKSRVR